MRYHAPHDATDETKLASMIQTLNAGETLPHIVALPDGTAISGSHRIAAWDACDMDHSAIELIDEQIDAAMRHANIEDWDEFADNEEMCRAVYATCEDDEIRDALRDQI